ncbi:hypothetical protein CHKEEEPN_3435 [Methylorubrum podarium]|nr:hypothetical protein CHKEEEPN_3435 [Methylorubrum podarium]
MKRSVRASDHVMPSSETSTVPAFPASARICAEDCAAETVSTAQSFWPSGVRVGAGGATL